MNYAQATAQALLVIGEKLVQEKKILKMHIRNKRRMLKASIDNAERQLEIALECHRKMLVSGQKVSDEQIRDQEQRYLFQRQRLQTIKAGGSDDTIDLGKYFETLMMTSAAYDHLFEKKENHDNSGITD